MKSLFIVLAFLFGMSAHAAEIQTTHSCQQPKRSIPFISNEDESKFWKDFEIYKQCIRAFLEAHDKAYGKHNDDRQGALFSILAPTFAPGNQPWSYCQRPLPLSQSYSTEEKENYSLKSKTYLECMESFILVQQDAMEKEMRVLSQVAQEWITYVRSQPDFAELGPKSPAR